ncbi:acetate uptake transporter [Acidithiobacillus caldus]|uniref:acetate uptake transporter n=1 Tax=Acidithiobacillus caldus TaxID=33059 RepID=UPI001C07DD9A|nr:acetate uptake transporter [Acidithiobacillus caldus]MBU2822494.1 acetate uptake transporter [Acidithiobacillus caldus]
MKDPIAIGLFGFAVPLFIIGAMFHGLIPMAGVGTLLALCFGFGAAAMFVSGGLTYQMPNSYIATVFFTYGSFFLSFAIAAVSGGLATTMKSAPALLTIWFWLMALITVIFFLASLRANIGLVLLFGLLTVAFVLMALGNAPIASLLFMIVAVIGFYLAAVHVINPVMGKAILPVGSLAPKKA